LSPELDHKIRREIRDARTKDPLVSVVDLQGQFEKQFNRTFSRKYIVKLAFKVERRALQEADRTKIEERLHFTRENYRMMRQRLLKILYWKPEDGGKSPDRNTSNADRARKGGCLWLATGENRREYQTRARSGAGPLSATLDYGGACEWAREGVDRFGSQVQRFHRQPRGFCFAPSPEIQRT